MGTVLLAWRRVRHVFICVAEGRGVVPDEEFDPYFEDMRRFGFTHFLCIARGTPLLNHEQRSRTRMTEGVSEILVAIVFDGSPLVRSVAMAFAWFIPGLELFYPDQLDDALNFAAVDHASRPEFVAAIDELTRSIREGTPEHGS